MECGDAAIAVTVRAQFAAPDCFAALAITRSELFRCSPDCHATSVRPLLTNHSPEIMPRDDDPDCRPGCCVPARAYRLGGVVPRQPVRLAVADVRCTVGMELSSADLSARTVVPSA